MPGVDTADSCELTTEPSSNRTPSVLHVRLCFPFPGESLCELYVSVLTEPTAIERWLELVSDRFVESITILVSRFLVVACRVLD